VKLHILVVCEPEGGFEKRYYAEFDRWTWVEELKLYVSKPMLDDELTRVTDWLVEQKIDFGRRQFDPELDAH